MRRSGWMAVILFMSAHADAGLFGKAPSDEIAARVVETAVGRFRLRAAGGAKFNARVRIHLRPKVNIEFDEYGEYVDLRQSPLEGVSRDPARTRIWPDDTGRVWLIGPSCAEVDRMARALDQAGFSPSPRRHEFGRENVCRLDVTDRIPARLANALGAVQPRATSLGAALFAAGLREQTNIGDGRGLVQTLALHCVRRRGIPRFGDVVVIFEPRRARKEPKPAHAFWFGNDELVFEKEGGFAPFQFSRADEVFGRWAVDPLDQYPRKVAGRRFAWAYACVR